MVLDSVHKYGIWMDRVPQAGLELMHATNHLLNLLAISCSVGRTPPRSKGPRQLVLLRKFPGSLRGEVPSRGIDSSA